MCATMFFVWTVSILFWAGSCELCVFEYWVCKLLFLILDQSKAAGGYLTMTADSLQHSSGRDVLVPNIKLYIVSQII